MNGKLICIAGPTASGKTGLSVRLAEALDAEIVSCDSMQIYRHMDIGTAKPTKDEMRGIRHHMLDVADPWEDYSVGKYVQQADACVQDILRRGRPVIVVGGTGLYSESLVLGRGFAPVPSTGQRQRLEARALEEGPEALRQELLRIDPEAYDRIAATDSRRIIRALEVFYETGKTITEHNRLTQLQPPRYDCLWLGLDDEDRSVLYDRINRRVDDMLRQGLMEEIDRLVSMGVPRTATAMQAIGYKEFLMEKQGELSHTEAVELVKQRSRNYAKRQLTWFRRNREIHWLIRGQQDNSDTIFSAARQAVRKFAPDA